jgi:hypothetical protein
VKTDIITKYPAFLPTQEVVHDGASIVLRGVVPCTADQFRNC